MFQITDTPLETLNLHQGFQDEQAGAFVCFEGRVRNHNDGRHVGHLKYEANLSLCETEAEAIFQEVHAQYPLLKALCVHRTGHIAVKEMAVWVGVTAVHRDEAFLACRAIIDKIKHRLPIWKKEHYTDGDSGWVNCQRCTPKAPKNCEDKPQDGFPSREEALALTIDMQSIALEDVSKYTFIDIREDVERLITPINELKTIHLPLSKFHPDQFQFKAETPYIIVCAKGLRSLDLVEQLRAQGLPNTQSLENGLNSIKDYFQQKAPTS